MLDIVFYFVLSGIEFFSGFIILMSFFNINIRHHIIESIIGTILITTVSYLLVRLELYQIIPMPVIVAVLFVFVLTRLFKKKLLYSIVASIGASLIYGVIQSVIVYLFVEFGIITIDQINDPFASNSYIIQSLCSVITLTVSLYIRLNNSGFGFTLKKSKGLYFGLSSVVLIIVCSTFPLLLNQSEYQDLFVPSIIVIVISYIIFYLLSYKTEQVEYSTPKYDRRERG